MKKGLNSLVTKMLTPTDEFGFPTRAVNALRRYRYSGIYLVGDMLLQLTTAKLLVTKDVHKTTVAGIEQRLETNGLTFAQPIKSTIRTAYLRKRKKHVDMSQEVDFLATPIGDFNLDPEITIALIVCGVSYLGDVFRTKTLKLKPAIVEKLHKLSGGFIFYQFLRSRVELDEPFYPPLREAFLKVRAAKMKKRRRK